MHNKLRTEDLERSYQEFRKTDTFNDGCVLCKEEPLKLFTHWKIIIAKFPYNRIANMHHMIVPIKHKKEVDLSAEEQQELAHIKESELNDYDFLMEPTHKGKSIPNHFHIHLIKFKNF